MTVPKSMRAAVYTRYGAPDVVSVETVPTPQVGPNDLLVRVRATTVSTADWRLRSFTMPRGFGLLGRLALGITAPRTHILGGEFSGDVVAIGAAVTNFAVGDAVIACPGSKLGAHAEYCRIAANGVVVPKPPQLGYDVAAAIAFGGMTALDFFRRGALCSKQKVLVNGASGTVGSAMVQLAVDAGAEVTAVCSDANAALMRSLGAVRVVDYTTTDFAAEGVRYDLIADTVGNAPYARVRDALMPSGKLLAVLAPLSEMLRAPWVGLTTQHSLVAGPTVERVEDLRTLVAMVGAGRFTPVIDCCVPLEEIVAAHGRVESGRKRGSVVVMVDRALRTGRDASDRARSRSSRRVKPNSPKDRCA